MKKHLLFDFDGVIVDSFELCFSISQKFHDKPGLTRKMYREFFNGNVYEASVSHDKNEDKIPSDDPWFIDYTKELINLNPVEGVVEIVKELSNEYKMMIISSSLNASVQKFLDKHGLLNYFEQVLGADVHKSKVVKIQRVLDEKEVNKSHALFITDTLGDIREAQKVGISSLGVAWGFHPEAHLVTGNPNAVITSPLQMIPEIQRILS